MSAFAFHKIQWGPAPDVLPKGAEAAVLYGDPAREGQFALRIKLPSGYHVPPHSHPVDENVTVISGTFKLGMGEKADQSMAQPLPAGSFFSLPPGTNHYVYTDEETVIQINTMGPWGLVYVNPQADPRKKDVRRGSPFPDRPEGGGPNRSRLLHCSAAAI